MSRMNEMLRRCTGAPRSGIDLKVLVPAAFVLGFAAVGIARGASLLPVHVGTPESGFSPEDPRYSPAADLQPGTQMLMIYLGQASCSQSNREGLPRMVKEIKARLRTEANERGWSFRVLGVALDRRVDAGLKHLAQFGAFDEVAVGGSWLNSAAYRFLWGTMAGPPSTPQVLVVRRTWSEATTGPVGVFYTLEDGRMLARRVGFGEIATWHRTGVYLPEPDLATDGPVAR